MRPPICELCNARFDPAPDALLSFAVDDETRTFDRRSERTGFAGHRPNQGWFCPEHIEVARTHTGRSLSDALCVLRPPLEPSPARSPARSPKPSPIGAGERGRRQRQAEAGLVRAELPVSVDVFELHERLREFRPTLMTALGLADHVELVRRTTRTWNPMDGAREPDCPYTDRVVDEAELAGIEQGIELEANWWNPDTLSNASARLFILERRSPSEWGTHVARITGGTEPLSSPPSRTAPVHTLSVMHPGDAAVAACIADFARRLTANPSGS